MERTEEGRWNRQTIFEKALADGWTLRKIAHEQVDAPPGKGCYWDEHELRHEKSLNPIACHDWEWADFDRGHVVWAESGKLYRSALFAGAGVRPALLHDFTPYAFEPIEAPYTEAGNRPHKRKAKHRK